MSASKNNNTSQVTNNSVVHLSTMPELVHYARLQYGDKIALKEHNFALNYTQLTTLAYSAAKALLASGIVKGDRVAIWAPNIYEWIIAALGAHCAGAVLVPINTRWKGSEAAFVLQRSGAKMLFTLSEFKPAAGQSIEYLSMLSEPSLAAPLSELQECVILRSPDAAIQDAEESQEQLNLQAKIIGWHEFLVRAERISETTLQARMQSIQAHDVMDMLFTSGTTGKPKGVLCAHQQNIRTVSTWAETVGLNSADNYLIINPFFHSFGYKAGWMAALIKGAKILPVLSFDLDQVLQQIEDDKVSVLPGPPTIYQSLLNHPKRADYKLDSLRLAVTGAAAVPVKLIEDMRQILNFKTVVTAYGLTETCGFVSICRPDDDPQIISNSSGRAMDGVEVKCVDDQGDTVEAGQAGEIWVRGYNVMQAYFDDLEATQKAINADGWLKTGDIGVMDENGYLAITDRLKDMYICGGFNVYPAEIENQLAELDGVAQVAIIGVDDERMGEVGKAYVVKKAGASIDAEDILKFSKNNFSNYKVPRIIEFVDELPCNASGKVLKTTLRQWSK